MSQNSQSNGHPRDASTGIGWIFSPPIDEFTSMKVPFPAFGIVGRGYPLPQLAINFELSGFKLPESIDPNYKAK